MSERASPRWRTTKYRLRGVPVDNYECNHCPFATLDRGLIERHANAAHPLPSQGGGAEDPLSFVPFASLQAEKLARHNGLQASDFRAQSPSSPTGYTAADVRRLVASAASPPEEE